MLLGFLTSDLRRRRTSKREDESLKLSNLIEILRKKDYKRKSQQLYINNLGN